MNKLILSLVLAVTLVVVPSTVALAATDTVTVTATPGYVAFTNAPNSWTLNGITGSSVINPNTTYYSNPLGDTTPPQRYGCGWRVPFYHHQHQHCSH